MIKKLETIQAELAALEPQIVELSEKLCNFLAAGDPEKAEAYGDVKDRLDILQGRKSTLEKELLPALIEAKKKEIIEAEKAMNQADKKREDILAEKSAAVAKVLDLEAGNHFIAELVRLSPAWLSADAATWGTRSKLATAEKALSLLLHADG